MHAVAYSACLAADQPDAFLDLELPEPPAPEGHDLLVEVRAVSVNPVDTKQRQLNDPKGKPRVLGFDAAGVVRATGPDCTLFRPGEEVFYAGLISRPGSNADLQLVDERIVGRKPATLSFAQAAALPLTSITAGEALFDRLRIARNKEPRPGEAVLLIGGAGGVGSMAIQLARQLTGLTVLATASRAETRAWCLGLGAHHVLDHGGDLPAQVKALGLSVPYIFSITQTARHWDASCAILAPLGLICAIDQTPVLDTNKLKQKAGGLVWEAMFARPGFRTPDMVAQHHLLNAVAELVDAGAIRSTMTEHFGPLTAANLARAHLRVESGSMIGKVVLGEA